MYPETPSRQWVYSTALCIDAAVLPSRKRCIDCQPENGALLSSQTNLWRKLNSELPYPIYGYMLPRTTHMVIPNYLVVRTLTHMNAKELSKFSLAVESYIGMLRHLNSFVLAIHGYITMLVDRCKPLLASISPPSLSSLFARSPFYSDLMSILPEDAAQKFTIWYREMMSFLLELSIWVKELGNAQSSFSPIIHLVTNYSCLKDICRKQEIACQIIKFMADTEPIEIWIEQVEKCRQSEKFGEDSAISNWHDQQILIRKCLHTISSIVSIGFVEGSNRVERIDINTDISALFCSHRWSESSEARFKLILQELAESKQFFSNYKAFLYELSFLDDLKRPKARVISSAVPNLSTDGQAVLDRIWTVCSFAYTVETSLKNRDHFNSRFYGLLEGVYNFNLDAILENWIKVEEMLPLYLRFKMRIAKIQEYNILLDQIVCIVDSLSSVRDKYLRLNSGVANNTIRSNIAASLSSSNDRRDISGIKHCLMNMHKLLAKYLDLTGLKHTNVLKHDHLHFYVLDLLQMPKSSALSLSNDEIVNQIISNINSIS
ncbi:Hypothetical protein GLP15_99 [Giardia lamblia P15]|uniref:Dynein heavy chain n=1 Tax=Giardia intestinalis (strain P15) TaxID=658858 RepID=E1EX22_GIAIA|nr:Hypothetical protein GLP15_99 [Giardia lamblia P15]